MGRLQIHRFIGDVPIQFTDALFVVTLDMKYAQKRDRKRRNEMHHTIGETRVFFSVRPETDTIIRQKKYRNWEISKNSQNFLQK